MTAAILAGLVAGYAVAIQVGAMSVLLVGFAARSRLLVAAAAGMGIATADGLYALLSAVGGGAVSGLVRPIAAPLGIVAAIVLIGLSIRIAVLAIRDYHTASGQAGPMETPSGPLRAYLGFLGLTVLNPTTVIYFVALVLGRHFGFGVADGIGFGLAVFVASASWHVLLAAGGRLVGRVLTSRLGRLITALTSSAVIVVLAVVVLRTVGSS
ncbi:MAG TPA: lysine transporter LysE [Pseudonocardiaceae bacterium]|jgi:arginine exporter protein ArgO|nr:lysine transporter LysE [Pseudonocardiaceae bacterium]